jgi:hypothetical protein
VILDGQTAGEARVVRAHLDHNLPPTGELHADNFREVPGAEKHGSQSVLQVLLAPLSTLSDADAPLPASWRYGVTVVASEIQEETRLPGNHGAYPYAS